MPKKLNILVAALDWGLGHAARSLPLIDELQHQGAQPVLASAGRAGRFLQAERPGLPYLPLPAYDIRYASASMVWNMARQGPGLLKTVIAEHHALQSYIRRHQIAGVISDNRFGCFTKACPTVFLTHQLHIRTPSQWTGALANWLNTGFIRRFGACWVPDYEGDANLSHELGHPPLSGLPTCYIGPLSRFSVQGQPVLPPPAYESMTVLSGPEPQRSRLEQELLAQLARLPGRHLLAQGIPVQGGAKQVGRVTVYPYLGQRQLAVLARQSQVVISRPGYSSLMDWSALGVRHLLLIPTPGQTEQEYLAQHWENNGMAAVQQQGRVALARGLAAAKRTAESPLLPATGNSLLRQAVAGFLSRCRASAG